MRGRPTCRVDRIPLACDVPPKAGRVKRRERVDVKEIVRDAIAGEDDQTTR